MDEEVGRELGVVGERGGSLYLGSKMMNESRASVRLEGEGGAGRNFFWFLYY